MGDKACSFSITPPDIGSLITGILQNFKQIEQHNEITDHMLIPELRSVFTEVVNCWTAKVCSNEYTKGDALADASAASSEAIDEEVEKMADAIDDLIHKSAKYNIPRIISDESATRSYDNSCSQLLMCDSMREVHELKDKLGRMGNEAARIKLKNVVDYAGIVRDIADVDTKFWDVARLTYKFREEDYNEEHSVSSKAISEMIVILAISAIISVILTEIFEPFYKKQNEAYKDILKTCASTI